MRLVQPTSTRLSIRGLEANVLTWEPPLDAPASGLTVLMLHGFADAAATFDLVAPTIAREGHRVVAPDLRGFGDSARIGAGGYYHFPDYLADVVALLAQLAPERLAVVGHSMGGTISVQLAALRGKAIEKLVLLEGLGPPAHPMAAVPDRFARWLADLDAIASRPEHRSMSSLDEAVERLRANHPGVAVDVLRSRAPLLVRTRSDGRLAWKYDPLHRTTGPMPFLVEAFLAFLARIECPTLFVSGGAAGYHPDDEEDRFAALRDATRLELEGAGHMMHWTRPAETAAAIVAFLAR